MSDELKKKVWDSIDGTGGRKKDQCGAWINWDDYGDRSYPENEGWEIDHITAKANGGGDELSNLRPLQWKNNVLKGKGRLKTSNCVTAVGNVNVDNSVDDDTDD